VALGAAALSGGGGLLEMAAAAPAGAGASLHIGTPAATDRWSAALASGRSLNPELAAAVEAISPSAAPRAAAPFSGLPSALTRALPTVAPPVAPAAPVPSAPAVPTAVAPPAPVPVLVGPAAARSLPVAVRGESRAVAGEPGAAGLPAPPAARPTAGAPVTGLPTAVAMLPPTVASGGVLPPVAAPAVVPTLPAPRSAAPAVALPRSVPVVVGAPADAAVASRLAPPTGAAGSAGERSPHLALPGAGSRGEGPRVAMGPAVGPAVGLVHVVAKGETLWALSRQYHIGTEDLARLNHLPPDGLLRIGQRLVVPSGVLSVDGKSIKTDVAPLQHHRGVATSPLRFIVEGLGGSVSWIGPAQQVRANAGSRGVIVINIGSREARIGDKRVLMDLAAYLESDRTMVPARFVSEALDVTIDMDPSSGNITIRSNQ
jgi:hypothetical protein